MESFGGLTPVLVYNLAYVRFFTPCTGFTGLHLSAGQQQGQIEPLSMSPSRLRVFLPLLRHPLLWLAIVSLVLTFAMNALPADPVRAFQNSSPVNTNTPVPTLTPIPTTPAPDSTPTFTFTPPPTETAPVAATATLPIETQTPPPDLATSPPPFFETATPSGPGLPVETPPAPGQASDTPPPPVILVTATPPPVLAPTEALTTTIVITQAGGEAPPTQDADTLVELIDTFVLYSAYFLLGCGIIVFIALAVGFYYLNRRARTPD